LGFECERRSWTRNQWSLDWSKHEAARTQQRGLGDGGSL
jgi:hypothetical protein